MRHTGNKYKFPKIAVLICIVVLMLALTLEKNNAYSAGDNDPSNHKTNKRVAIIIDDFGNGQMGTEEMLSMPVKLTIAVMPFLPTTQRDAKIAHERGHDVIVHLPMEPKAGRPEWLGPGAITTKLSDAEIRQRVEAAIDNVPFAVGMNNHMGSKVTGDEHIMSIVLDVCKERGLFFVDSHTNYRSIVGKVAAQKGMPVLENNIFLDDVASTIHVSKQLQKIGLWLRDHDQCVSIGHVGLKGKYTAAALKQSIPKMQENAKFVGVTDLVQSIWQKRVFPTLP
ncbi:divergent polysaccharide deacetylase family protein [Paenibacillus sediminis]|uniref:Polysaccharide deacetylase 2 family uncharacterized protein YibQ n=1 Tax=Paenibacillus sediminis TaxID=664909 RepID=A0ABS4H686_9BACL|nr:divergent polysaccharide deacetylase family protein [Paenibacillus sediminis]MBP1938053.1 polysaccharide deacetylase 2 family uncharacterized protein YibQ [Paenibacillus sediminis]